MTAKGEQTCPLCGRDNHCAIAAGGDGKDCWCREVKFEPGLLAQVPAPDRGTRCICRQCAEQGRKAD